MKKILIAVFVLASAAASAQSTNATLGHFWHEQCNQSGQIGKHNCIAFMIGLIRGSQLQASMDEKHTYFCLPNGITYEQMGDVFAKYLADHPESRHESAAYLATMSLAGAYPCNK